MVITFNNLVPIPRDDDVPWTQAQIEEAAANTGPWTVIDTLDLDPVDTDPAHPMVRSLTTAAAAAEPGLWYRIVFLDDTGNQEQPTEPVRNPDFDVNYRPSVVQVAALVRERTNDTNGNQLGTFTPSTRPTGDQVEELIDQAVLDVYDVAGATPAAAVSRVARRVATLGAAMAVELSYFPTQVSAGRSPYKELKDLYDERLKALVALITSLGADGEPGTSDDEGIPEPSYSFGMEGGCHVPGAESPWPERPTWYGLGGRL